MSPHDLVISDHRDDDRYDPGRMVEVASRPQLMLTDTSPNGHLVYRDNPVSFFVSLLSCIPFLNFNGSDSAASQDAAAAAAATPQYGYGDVGTPGPSPAPSVATASDNPLGAFGTAFGLTPAATLVPGPVTTPTTSAQASIDNAANRTAAAQQSGVPTVGNPGPATGVSSAGQPLYARITQQMRAQINARKLAAGGKR